MTSKKNAKLLQTISMKNSKVDSERQGFALFTNDIQRWIDLLWLYIADNPFA